MSIFNILTGQKQDMTKLKLVWLVNTTGHHSKIVLSPVYYSVSRKTVNTRENFWNVHCFVTNQKRDETTKITAKPQHALVTASGLETDGSQLATD